MVKLPVNQLKPGMKVAQAITTKRGQIISKVGTELNDQLIARLVFYKIEEVVVEDPPQAAAPVEPAPVAAPEPAPAPQKEAVSEQISYSQKLKASPMFQKFQMDYALNTEYLKENFEALLSGGGAECCDMIIENLEPLFVGKTNLELLDIIHNMRGSDDTVYAHSLNVALITRAIGRWCKIEKPDLNTLTLAGILHDIGKLQVPDEILNKTGKLTDEEFKQIQAHTLNGNKILKGKGFDQRIVFAALQHHERADGSGYPRNLTVDEMDDFASIIAIADVYDAMTAYRSYRKPLCAFEVIAAFEKDGFQKYDTKYLLCFLEHIAAAYQNARVLLSDGRAGRVVYLNKSKLSRPIIELDNKEIMDLSASNNSEIYIQSIL